MSVASLDLCKELYTLSGWADTKFSYYTAQSPWGPRNMLRLNKGSKTSESIPAYDLGYLLRKLPVKVGNAYSYLHLSPGAYGDWSAYYLNEQQDNAEPVIAESADTPEDAAAKLTVELLKQGVLQQ